MPVHIIIKDVIARERNSYKLVVKKNFMILDNYRNIKNNNKKKKCGV